MPLSLSCVSSFQASVGDDMLDIDLVQLSGLHHAGERDQREQRVVIAGASELAKLG